MITDKTLADYIMRLKSGERSVLSRCMTLIESNLAAHQQVSEDLLDAIMPVTGHGLRLGITGTPGAGKSTFIDALGILLIEKGYRVAVIAVDPSSTISGGSLLIDKTRMYRLAQSDSAFIRPVPSGGHPGGTSQRAHELLLLCEAAGYDIVIVETVGVGQSETEVASLTDCFISLQTTGAGDEMQVIKKGVMELADILIINKDDGDNRQKVAETCQMYQSVLALHHRKYHEWQPRVFPCSAREQRGLHEIWQALQDFKQVLTESGRLTLLRQQQTVDWLRFRAQDTLLRHVLNNPRFANDLQNVLVAAKNQTISSRSALEQIKQLTQRIHFL